MTTQHANVLRVTGYRILHGKEPSADPFLILTTAEGDHCFVLDRPLFQKLALSCEKAGRESV